MDNIAEESQAEYFPDCMWTNGILHGLGVRGVLLMAHANAARGLGPPPQSVLCRMGAPESTIATLYRDKTVPVEHELFWQARQSLRMRGDMLLAYYEQPVEGAVVGKPRQPFTREVVARFEALENDYDRLSGHVEGTHILSADELRAIAERS